MRYAMLLKADEKTEAGARPSEGLLRDMGRLNEEMTQAGVMLTGEGLKPSSRGMRVRYAGGTFTIVDGPFSETKELIAGLSVLRVKSKEEAIDWSARCLEIHVEHTGVERGAVEVRRLYELDDFPVSEQETKEGWRDKERDARAAAESAPPVPVAPGKVRYIAMIRSDKHQESGALPSEKTLTDMGALMGELGKKGALLGGEGLKPSNDAARITYSRKGAKRTVVDGPFTEAKEMIAGYMLVQASSREEVLEWVKRWLEIHAAETAADESVIEVREMYEMSDFVIP